MDDDKTLDTNIGSLRNESIETQEQSTAAPTVPGEDNGAEQPVETHELNEGTESAKDDKAADDQKVPEGDGEPENAKAEGDRKVEDPRGRYFRELFRSDRTAEEAAADAAAEAFANAYIMRQLKKIQRSFIPRYED